jgi:hypothetical protein
MHLEIIVVVLVEIVLLFGGASAVLAVGFGFLSTEG